MNAVLSYVGEWQKEPFQCVRTECDFCPFRDSAGNCLDLLSPINTPAEKWYTARTATEWREWLERFKSEIDPNAPYSDEVEVRIDPKA